MCFRNRELGLFLLNSNSLMNYQFLWGVHCLCSHGVKKRYTFNGMHGLLSLLPVPISEAGVCFSQDKSKGQGHFKAHLPITWLCYRSHCAPNLEPRHITNICLCCWCKPSLIQFTQGTVCCFLLFFMDRNQREINTGPHQLHWSGIWHGRHPILLDW